MTQHVLLAWIGKNDLRHATRTRTSASPGPIGQAVLSRQFSHLFFLSDHDPASEELFCTWLES